MREFLAALPKMAIHTKIEIPLSNRKKTYFRLFSAKAENNTASSAKSHRNGIGLNTQNLFSWQ
jgi:hypothetical protein